MVREIMHDMIILSRKSEEALPSDLPHIQDLMDTLSAHRAECVGMAGNMIGISKRFIAFFDEGSITAMINPRIIMKSDPYETQEGCLSLSGVRKALRYNKIRVEYLNLRWQKKTRTFTGFTAQIIQHEVDHCEGILI